MQRTMELALKGIGYVSPNPLVGCVIVHDGKIIGEGYHQKYGQAHAEVNAINAVADKSLLRESTLYVNLEPCSHFGKTPPCADLLIKHNVKKVVIANVDSNPLVGGKGITKLREAGVEVVTNVLEQEGRELNKRFFTFIEKQRPYLILKWAQTSDRFIARNNFDSKWISSELSRQLVHRWRSEEAAILVGKNTALHDDPQLNVRNWTGPNPVRIVIDRNLSLPKHLKMFTDNDPTLVYNVKESDTNGIIHRIRVSELSFYRDLIVDLYRRGLQSVIIEGGASTLRNFIDLALWDEARVFTSPQEFREGIPAPQVSGTLISSEMVDTDVLKIYRHEP
ncbi:MAG TPA: bifunctional diaminohydroxyphosphoribosylaminopyrimidine deaminase/5-amino-6-(5-phosphoribosylamino)uracil reductase RibD [Chryseosolibacter sp.]